MSTSFRTLVLCGACLAGSACASGRLLLEKPIADRCVEAGVKACDLLTEGILLCLDGDSEAGKKTLRKGIRANSPEELKAFADALKALSRIPAVASYMGPLKEIVDLVGEEAADIAKQRGASARDGNSDERGRTSDEASRRSERPSRNQGNPDAPNAVQLPFQVQDTPTDRSLTSAAQILLALTTASDISRWRGGTVVPATEVLAKPCTPGSPFPVTEKTKGYCVRVIEGPLVVTELHVPGSCAGDMYAVGGSLSEPRWIGFAPAGGGLNISGAMLVVREREHLVIGVSATNDSKIGRDVRCSVTWAGWAPAVPKKPVAGGSAEQP
jgi:hypothetical protein